MKFPRQSVLCTFAVTFLFPMVLFGQVVVDNDDGAPAYTESGAWTTSGSTGYNGGTYNFATGGTAKSATWTADLPTAGQYELFVWYVPGSNRATSAKYDIAAADGNHTVYVNQTGGGYTWDSIGTFSFNAGSNTITLDAAGSSEGAVVIADAVRFGGSGTSEYVLDYQDEVSAGVCYQAYSSPAPRAVHVLEFDLSDPQYTIDMGFARGKRNYNGNDTVTQITEYYDAPGNRVVGAVNCSFFEAGQGIVGMLGTGGNVISTRDDTWWDQQTYMLQQSGEGWAASDLPGATPTAKFLDGAELGIDIVDLPCQANAITLYTPDWDSSTKSSSQGVELIVRGVNFPLRPNKDLVGTITAVRTGAASLNNAIPDDGFVLAAGPGAESELLSHASVGEQIQVRFAMSTAELANMKTLCTGNAWMVKDGAPWHGGGPERHPRSVLAWSGTRHWFVAFDGRQPGYSVGASVAEMQTFLIDTLHVDNAINLDGGGSTTLLVDGSVMNCPSDGATTPCTGTERAVANALMLVKSEPTSTFPISDDFPASGRSLTWDDKFTLNPVVPYTPTPAGGDGYVLEVMNPAGGFETVSAGKRGDVSSIVSASVYCEYRPELAGDGFERVGLFARDDGNANFDSTEFGGGNCYALTYDSHDGRVRAGVVVDGVFTDFLEASPVYITSTAWRTFKIDCFGSRIIYLVDRVELARVSDTSHLRGRFGIGHHEYFGNNENAHGAHVDNFNVYALDFDYDNDGDVDDLDARVLIFCMLGPSYTYPETNMCLTMDGDGDRDVDLLDFAVMMTLFGV